MLPEGLTKEDIEKVQDFRNAIIPPLTQVVAEKTHDVMLEDESILDLSVSAFYGQEEIGMRVYRNSKSVDEEGSPVDVFGQVIVSNKTNLGSHQQEYDSVMEAIEECFTKSFSKGSK